MMFGPLTSFIMDQGADVTGLGRWVWTLVGTNGGKKTRFVTAYQPCDNRTGDRTVLQQHSNYFEPLGIKISPRTLFVQQLLEFLAECKANGEEIILYIDANENVYSGRLAKALTNDDFNMTEQFYSVTGQQAPASHSTGTRPITGLFATAGIRFLGIYMSAHNAGIGDHRYTVYDVDASSVLGIEIHSGKRPVTRRLRTNIPRHVKQFNRCLEELVDRHRMFKKLADINSAAPTSTEVESARRFNKWDDELTDFMRGTEVKSCGKKYSGKHDSSPTFKFWLQRRRIWKRAKEHLLHPLPDPRNLYRDLKAQGFPKPSEITLETVEIKIKALDAKIERLKQDAPDIRSDHLEYRRELADKRGDADAVQQIERIIRKENDKKGWGVCRATHGKPRGRSVMAVQVTDSNGEVRTCNTREEVESAAAECFNSRFRLSASAPIFSSPLIEYTGLMGEKPAVKQILNGTFVYPPGSDYWTVAIFQEACSIFKTMSPEDIVTLVECDDFQYFWKSAREETASSFSDLHFGLYKANSHSRKLSSLHAAKLTLAAKLGISLSRWHKALTVLIEKTFGCILLEKIRAICLLEADYNWLMRLIFSKRMMDNARLKGIIPADQFAKKGSKSQDGCLVKTLFFDRARVLHQTSGVVCADFSQCYDSVAHPIASVGLQAWGVPLMMVKVMLSVLQTMRFFIRSGFGDATESYGGSEVDKMGGLGQGNGAAPPAFTVVSTLLLMAYINMGHGVKINSAISGILFTLAAIIYVDDTDLLHWAPRPDMTDEEFFDHVQEAALAWGNLAIASGGALKPEKCFWYLISFKFRHGVAYYKALDELPSRQMMIPARDGSLKPITLKATDEATKTLGVTQDVEGNPTSHLEKMQKQGFDWADQANTKPLPRRLARQSYDCMLVPRMRYGIECLLATPSELSSAMRKVLFRCLPHLGVNRNYKSEFVTLPRKYQGLALTDWPIEKLSADLHVMLQYWSSPCNLGLCLREAYQLLQMETGLDGNIFLLSFQDFGHLATHSWMKILWQYLDEYDIKLELCESTNIPKVRDNDCSIIQALFAKGYRGRRLWVANTVRKFKRVFRLSCFTAMDGRHILKSIFDRTVGESSWNWSTEVPTAAAFKLWNRAITELSSRFHVLPTALGAFRSIPHNKSPWTVNSDGDVLCRTLGDGSFALYELCRPFRFTRSGPRFSFRRYSSIDPSLSHMATVLDDPSSSTAVRLHSSALLPSPPPTPLGFFATLLSWDNQTLWKHLYFDGDGSWILDALCAGTLDIVHDGSYMKKVSPLVCSMALLMICRATGQELRCTWVEFSSSADNYRAELLGAVCCSLLLKAASSSPAAYSNSTLKRHCDNMGVIKHGNRIYARLKDGQAQADLIRLFQVLDQDLPFPFEYVWVASHTDDPKKRHKHKPIQLTHIHSMNERVDSYAKSALVDGVMSRDFISSSFPFEPIRIYAGSSKFTGSLRPFITNHHAKGVAKRVFGYDVKRGKKLISDDDFHLVFWDVIELALKGFPKPFMDWLSKHVTGCCGVNRFLSKWDPSVTNHCPCCGRHNEDIYHITTCNDPGRTEIFLTMVEELGEWLDLHNTPPFLRRAICQYLRHRNTKSMTQFIPYGTPFHAFAQVHDRLGWRSFLEGRIPTVLVQEMHSHLSTTASHLSGVDWAKGLVNFLFRITHRQWTFRNSVVHFTVEGRTPQQHQEIIAEMERLLEVDPKTLLPRFRHLWEDRDFENLGAGSATAKLYWIDAARAAIAASAIERRRKRQRRRDFFERRATQTATDAPPFSPDSYEPPPVPREPGFRYKKRRLK